MDIDVARSYLINDPDNLNLRSQLMQIVHDSGIGTVEGLRLASGLGDPAAQQVCSKLGLIPIRNVTSAASLLLLSPYPVYELTLHKPEKTMLENISMLRLGSLELDCPEFCYDDAVRHQLQVMNLRRLDFIGLYRCSDTMITAPTGKQLRTLGMHANSGFDNDFLQSLAGSFVQELSLSSCNDVDNHSISTLLTLPLRRLTLTRTENLTAKSIARLSELPLEHLSLDWNWEINNHKDCLSGFSQLTSLSLNQCYVSDENLAAISECKLEFFEAESNYITVDGLDFLLPMPIQHLHIGSPRGLDDFTEAIDKITRLPLQHFEFSDVDDIEADVFQLIAEMQLQSLDLSLSGIRVKGFKHLRNKTFEKLDLSFCNFDATHSKALRQLAKSGLTVKSLHISGLNLCDDDLQYFKAVGIEELNLYDSTWLTDKGVKYLASLPLKSLTIGADPGDSKLTDVCVDTFSHMKLEELTLFNARLSESAWERLYQLPARIRS